MKKLLITLSFIFISGICSAQIAIDSIRGYWSGNMLDSIYLEYTSYIPHIDTLIYNNAANDGLVRMNLLFSGCSTTVSVQKDTAMHFFNDSIFVLYSRGLRFLTFWNVSPICNQPNDPVVTDGKILYPVPTSVKEAESLENKVRIYPNPVSESFTLNLLEDIQLNQLELIDLQGRLVKNFHNSKTRLDVSDLSSGVYFVKITTDQGVAMKKIVVN